MNTYEIFYIIGLLGILYLTGYRIYNLFHKGEKYEISIFFITIFATLISFMFTLFSVMFITDTVFYSQLFIFVSMLLIFNIPLIMGELFFYIGNKVTKNKMYNSKEYWAK